MAVDSGRKLGLLRSLLSLTQTYTLPPLHLVCGLLAAAKRRGNLLSGEQFQMPFLSIQLTLHFPAVKLIGTVEIKSKGSRIIVNAY